MALETYHRHMTQRVSTDPYWQYNCSAYSGAMLINDATLGGMFGITGRLVREMSSEPKPDPASPGLNIPQIITVGHKLKVKLDDLTSRPWDDLIHALNIGRRVMLQVDYATLGKYRAQANGDFGHMLVLIKVGSADPSTIIVSDPLAPNIKSIPKSVLQDAGRTFARETGLNSGLRWSATRRIPRIEK